MSKPRLALLALPPILALSSACEDVIPRDDAGIHTDGGPEQDGGRPDGSTRPDATAGDGSVPVDRCDNPPLTPPATGTCTLTAGDGNLLIRSNLMLPDRILENAQLLIGADGKIACATCDCSGTAGFATATRLECAQALVTPGLINAHDHVTFDEGGPAPHGTEVYEHRHDWRKGIEGHTKIPSPQNKGGDLGVRWAEVRMLMAGVTSINGSGSAKGLLRNLDKAGATEGLTQPAVRYSTFPLRDSSGKKISSGCNYGTTMDALTDNAVAQAEAYTPHIAEGIDEAAKNEILCLSGVQAGGSDVIAAKTGVIHGIGLTATEYQELAREQASLIWSPRSNIDLYGQTAMVTVASRLGVNLALGTDWTPTGSINVLRELRCADSLNRTYYGGFFDDAALVRMATLGAARALWSDDLIGQLKSGHHADIAIFDARAHAGYRAVLDAQPDDVVLVLRSGEPLYGDSNLIFGLTENAATCETIDVCSREKRICVERDTGTNLDAIKAAIRPDYYPLFFCGTPENEPSCTPRRPGEYTGMSSADDQDGDGIPNASDLCPTVFDPPREFDQGHEPNTDGDDYGDACDPCPLSSDNANCPAPRPDDRDADGVGDADDNCPGNANADQADDDHDNVGNACDSCPGVANTPGAACPVTVYDVKLELASGQVALEDLVVTAVAPAGFFVQVLPGSTSYDAAQGAKYSGLYVYTGKTGDKPARGDRLSVTGNVEEFYGELELTNPSFTVRGSGATVAPTLATAAEVALGGARETELEGVLVEVRDVEITNVDPDPGAGDSRPTSEVEVQGGLRINDLMYKLQPFPVVGQRLTYVQGILRHANGFSKLEPRDANDVASPAALQALIPPMVFIPAGSSTTALTVILTRTATAPVVVTLAGGSTDLVVPPTITVPSGADRVAISMTAVAASTSTHTITASLGGATAEAGVRIYDASSVRRLVALELDQVRLAPSAVTQGHVAVDIPAAPGGLQVTLSVAPSLLGTVATSVAILSGQRSAAFELRAGTSTGSAEVVAQIAGSSRRAPFAVSVSTSRPLANAGDLVITEIHRNATGSSEQVREWVEVYNPTPDTLVLAGLILTDNTTSFTVPAPGAELPPGGYAVLAYSSDPSENGGITAAIAYGSAGIQLANGSDRVRLSLGATVIDEVSWASSWPGGANGESMCLLAPYAADNNVATAWGSSIGAYGPGADLGSPGAPNTSQNCQ